MKYPLLAATLVFAISACDSVIPPDENTPPSVNAGSDQSVDAFQNVNLSGSASDSDGSIASYQWKQLSGPYVSISGANLASASFSAPAVSNTTLFEFSFTAVDDDGDSNSDTVTITVNPQDTPNEPPQVDAGADQSVVENQTITLSGTASDSDGRIVSYLWQQQSGPNVSITNADLASASFTAPAVSSSTTLVFVLSAEDDTGDRDSDTVSITVNPQVVANNPPQVDAGTDQSVVENQTVNLNGTASDSDGSIVSYLWQQQSGPNVSISNADLASASFTAPSVSSSTQLIFTLTVADDDGASSSDSLSISVNPQVVANNPPQVDAGTDQTVVENQTVNLSGLASDSDGSITNYQWQQLSGISVTLSNNDQANTSFSAPAVSTASSLVFSFSATDDDGDSASDTLTITVNPQITAALPNFGPDPAQCPVTLAERGVNTVHVCDCQPGADASCVAGNDANAGTAAAPLQTLAAANAAFNAGSDIAFCRGGSWTNTNGLFLNLASCSAASPCVINDYGDAALAKPEIVISSDEPAISADPGDFSVYWAGVNIENLHLRSNNAPSLGSGIFFYRDINDVTLRCLDIEGFGIGVYINNDHISGGTNDISLYDSNIRDNGAFGWLGGSNGSVLERNRFDNNGYDGPGAFHHNLYFSNNTQNAVIRANHLSGSSLDSNGQCLGASLIVHSGSTTNLLVENNLVEESNAGGGCWGLNVDAVGNGEIHQNAIIRGNVVRNVGNQSIGISSCVDCTIENNLVLQNKFAGATGIAVPNRVTNAPDADNTGTIVRNNTVYFYGNGSGIAYYVGERGSNYVVTNNIGYHSNAILMNSDSCFNFDLPASAYDTVNSNLCFGAPFDINTTGMDGSASTSDPQFVNAPDDLRIDATSQARDSGTTVSNSSTDILGNARDSAPDRGAYEYQ